MPLLKSAAGAAVEVLKVGAPDHPVRLVLVHAAVTGARSLVPLARLLTAARACRAWLVNLPGYGQSER